MCKKDIKVSFYYGDEDFKNIIEKIIFKKISMYSSENVEKIYFGKKQDEGTICQG
ncbi:hypothetical protein [Clostridium rectalis]|uniref:hypothetical protein n=1 Tax=Clostridium rectalis TaxID=2040295 RepID=UPI0013DE4B5A|nr:hypothetical protein [Clostridium rectalis]